MSFDVWVQWFDGGRKKPVSTAEIMAMFRDAIVERDHTRLVLRYGPSDNTEVLMRPDAHGHVTGVTVHRPCAAPALWSALAAILQSPNAVCYWPESRPVTGTGDAIPNLPVDMLSLGAPIIISTGAELQHLVTGALSKRGPTTR